MTDVEISKIKIGHRFRENLGDMTSLMVSIERLGLLQPVVVNEDYELIDGFRRITAFKNLDRKKIPTYVINLDDMLRGEFDANELHKQYSPSEKVAIFKALEVRERQRAEERKLTGKGAGDSGGRGRKKPPGKLPGGLEGGDTRDILGKKVGMSGKNLEKAEKVVEAARKAPKKYQKVKDEMDETGNVDRAYRKVTSAEKREKMTTVELPADKFSVLYADPPWKYEFAQSGSREVENKYPTMELDDICKIKAPAADDAILFLWVTVPKLREGLKVVEAWGFEYKTGMVWVKDKIGMGYYVRSKHELLLIATRGKFGPPAEDCRPESVIVADRGKHSEKPAVVYELIEKMYPGHKYIELFARSKREGWTSWGNESG